MESVFSRIFDLLRSLKLAIILIAILGLLAAAGGLIPQGAASDFYAAHYSGLLGRLIERLSFNTMFSSPLFLASTALFALNLTLCSFQRFTVQLSLPGKLRRHGPDILHIGLIILILGGTWSSRLHEETSFSLTIGAETSLPGGEMLRLEDFTFERYPDGRPKVWNSRISIDADGETVVTDYPLRVNHPLRYKGYTVYQSGYSELPVLVMTRGKWGIPEQLAQGERLTTEDGFVLFMAIEPQTEATTSNYVFLVESRMGRKVIKASLGEKIGPLTILGTETNLSSSITVKRDPAYPIVLAGLILAALGSILSYIRKLLEKSS